jgi:hypothetical protein
MELLKQKLGKEMTPQRENAWSKTLDIAYKRIFEGLKACEVSNLK